MTEHVEPSLVVGPRAGREQHWDSIYEDAGPHELPWYEPVPSTLALVTANSDVDDAVIDVGGAASGLCRELLALGYVDLTVLDLSETALVRGRHLLGCDARRVAWIHADVTRLTPPRRWQLWHDRAVFHFLVDRRERAAYRSVAAASVQSGGRMIVATFAPDGPESCAGLPVRRYDQLGLASEFADDFEYVGGSSLRPASEVGDQRPYVAVVLRRRR